MVYQREEPIFGSPPEPIFNATPQGMNPEMLEQCLAVLETQNTDNTKNPLNKGSGLFKSGQCAEFLFLACERLRLPVEAKYLAIELFDKFMIQHIRDLYKHVLGLSSGDRKREWDGIMGRVRNQVLLRLVSCCQVASKLTSHYKIITPRKAQNTLKDFGYRYNTESIIQSELRVLRTLNYKVMVVTPLLFIETLLEILGHNDSETEVKVYHGVCMKLLDLTYIQWDAVYDHLFQIASKFTTPFPQQREKFGRVERDFMFLAVAIISATSYIMDQSYTDKVIENLFTITKIPVDDILDFATILIKVVIEENNKGK